MQIGGEGGEVERMADYDPNVKVEISEINRVIVEMICRGATNNEIAERLHYSLPAVKLRVRRLVRNLGARNRVELAAKAIQLDIVVEELSAEGFTDAEMLFLSQFSELPPETRAIIAEVGSALSRTLSEKLSNDGTTPAA